MHLLIPRASCPTGFREQGRDLGVLSDPESARECHWLCQLTAGSQGRAWASGESRLGRKGKSIL